MVMVNTIYHYKYWDLFNLNREIIFSGNTTTNDITTGT